VTVGDEQFVDDFPGEARRYVRRASGYHSVFVNGELAYNTDGYTDKLAGLVV
jgi:hypothetical protein